MKKIFKYSYVALMAVLMTALNACTDEYSYDGNPDSDNSGAYIIANSSDLTKVLTSDDDATAFSSSYTVARHDTAKAEDYTVYITGEGINKTETVKFAVGESRVTKTLDLSSLKTLAESGKKVINVKVKVSTVNDADGTGASYMYGARSQTYTVSVLNKIPGCQFKASWFMSDNTTMYPWDIDVYDYGEDTEKGTHTYYIKNPFGAIGEQLGLTVGDEYSMYFTLDYKGNATVDNSTKVFHFDNGQGVSGDCTVSGVGTWDEKEHAVIFSLSYPIGTTGYGLPGGEHDLVFPATYNPVPAKPAN